MAETGQRYEVKIVFRGLFLAAIHENETKDGTIDVLLPDASWPGRLIGDATGDLLELLQQLQPLREHQAVIEFPVADWDNRSAFTPGLVQVSKPTKEPVGLFFLDRHRIRFRGLWGIEGALSEHLLEDELLYTVIAEETSPSGTKPVLAVLRTHPIHGFDQLSQFAGTPLTDSPTLEENVVATTSFTFGEVYSERRSRRAGEDRRWEAIKPAEIGNPQDPSRARPLNLDLVVRFTLPLNNSLLVVCESTVAGGPEARHFILRPRDFSRGLTVWVKNRELGAILSDSDLLPDPFDVSCPDLDNVDRDHAFYMRLTERPKDLDVPRSLGSMASDCGSGCGGCGWPPPKP